MFLQGEAGWHTSFSSMHSRHGLSRLHVPFLVLHSLHCFGRCSSPQGHGGHRGASALGGVWDASAGIAAPSEAGSDSSGSVSSCPAGQAGASFKKSHSRNRFAQFSLVQSQLESPWSAGETTNHCGKLSSQGTPRNLHRVQP